MIIQGPGDIFEATVTFEQGLVGTLGVRIRTSGGADFLARTVAGISADTTVGTSTLYRVTLTAPTNAGQYFVVWDDGVDIITEELIVTRTAGGIIPDELPCTVWISGEDVAAVCDALDSSGDPSVYDIVALEASEILWAASGRQFSGPCSGVVVRPCVPSCGCWGWGWGSGFGFSWDSGGWWIAGGGGGVSAVQGWLGIGGGCYRNGCCGSLSRVKLANYPVTEIEEVKIDGVVIDPSNYRLDQGKYLTYLDDANGNPQRWPACQNLARADTETGTFSVTYTHGVLPPQIGLDAATQLACAIANAYAECALPAGTERITRQGIQIELGLPIQNRRGELPAGFEGLSLVKIFLATVNPNGNTRRSAFWSPDNQQFATRLGP